MPVASTFSKYHQSSRQTGHCHANAMSTRAITPLACVPTFSHVMGWYAAPETESHQMPRNATKLGTHM